MMAVSDDSERVVVEKLEGWQILIRAAFIKTFPEEVADITNAIPKVSFDPSSTAFRQRIENNKRTELLGVPSVLTANGRTAVVSVTGATNVAGKELEVGEILEVTPTIKPDGEIFARELVARSPHSNQDKPQTKPASRRLPHQGNDFEKLGVRIRNISNFRTREFLSVCPA